jgi:hypothetical protein
MRKPLTIITAAALTIGGVSFAPSNYAFADDAGDKAEQKAKEAGESAKESGEKAADAAKKLGEKASESADRAGEKAGDAAGAAAGELGQQARQAADKGQSDGQSFKRELRTELSSNPAVRNFERDENKGDIAKALAKVTRAATEDASFDRVRENLADADRERLEKQDFAAAAQLRDEWKSKYGDDLSVGDENLLGDDAQLVQAEVRDASLLTQWPLQATKERSFGGAAGTAGASGAAGSGAGTSGVGYGQAAGVGSPTHRSSSDDAVTAGGSSTVRPGSGAGATGLGSSQEKHLKKGDKIAVVRLPAQKDLPELTVSMVQKDGDWKLDIPDHLDARTLRSNLRQHLEQARQDKDNWPDDKAKATRYLSHHVLMALYDVDPRQSSSATGGAESGKSSGSR